jgi:hypothetical protein
LRGGGFLRLPGGLALLLSRLEHRDEQFQGFARAASRVSSVEGIECEQRQRDLSADSATSTGEVCHPNPENLPGQGQGLTCDVRLALKPPSGSVTEKVCSPGVIRVQPALKV